MDRFVPNSTRGKKRPKKLIAKVSSLKNSRSNLQGRRVRLLPKPRNRLGRNAQGNEIVTMERPSEPRAAAGELCRWSGYELPARARDHAISKNLEDMRALPRPLQWASRRGLGKSPHEFCGNTCEPHVHV
jgi:hypothetical protein